MILTEQRAYCYTSNGHYHFVLWLATVPFQWKYWYPGGQYRFQFLLCFYRCAIIDIITLIVCIYIWWFQRNTDTAKPDKWRDSFGQTQICYSWVLRHIRPDVILADHEFVMHKRYVTRGRVQDVWFYECGWCTSTPLMIHRLVISAVICEFFVCFIIDEMMYDHTWVIETNPYHISLNPLLLTIKHQSEKALIPVLHIFLWSDSPGDQPPFLKWQANHLVSKLWNHKYLHTWVAFCQ